MLITKIGQPIFKYKNILVNTKCLSLNRQGEGRMEDSDVRRDIPVQQLERSGEVRGGRQDFYKRDTHQPGTT